MLSFNPRSLLVRPIVLFDTHPQPASWIPGVVQYSFSRFTKTLSTAWTGKAHYEVSPGMLRLLWYTTDDVEGYRDYELRDSSGCKEAFDELLKIPDVARAMVLGYAGENPYNVYADAVFDKLLPPRDPKEEMLADGPQDWIKRKSKQRSDKGIVIDDIDDIIDLVEKEQEQLREENHPSGSQEV